jgi:alanyl-tRNA synthetase
VNLSVTSFNIATTEQVNREPLEFWEEKCHIRIRRYTIIFMAPTKMFFFAGMKTTAVAGDDG